MRRLASRHPVLLILDQLDALAGYLDLKTERLSVLLSLVRRIGGIESVHIVLSSRTFEFQHDVRLRAVSTEELSLQLPPWEEIRALLEARGVLAAGWPKDAQEVMRSPQALATYLDLKGPGALDAFSSYQEMLEHLWTTRILAPDGGARRARLATDIARAMAREESLWLALVQFEDRLDDIHVLESAGVLIRRKGSVGFTHQTVFEHVLARGFAGGEGQLTRYVLDRQSSLFLRPKLWVGLNYLRGVAPNDYHQEFETIWREPRLRDHLRLLLIDFLGRQSEPTDREALLMAQALDAPNHHRWQAYRAMSGSPGWFDRFRQTFIAEGMHGSEETTDAVTGVLVRAWAFAADEVVALLRDNWLPDSRHDERAWWVLQNAPHWTETALAIACTIVERTEIGPHLIDHVLATVGVDQPEAALRLAHARLARDLSAAKTATAERAGVPRPEFGSLDEEVAWHWENDPRRPLKALVEESQGWESLPALAEQAPIVFLEILWPWFEGVFSCAERDTRPPQGKRSLSDRHGRGLPIRAGERSGPVSTGTPGSASHRDRTSRRDRPRRMALVGRSNRGMRNSASAAPDCSCVFALARAIRLTRSGLSSQGSEEVRAGTIHRRDHDYRAAGGGCLQSIGRRTNSRSSRRRSGPIGLRFRTI